MNDWIMIFTLPSSPILHMFQEAKSCVDQLKAGLRIHITKLDHEELVFDLIGVDASLANALRRILLAEVMNVDHPYIYHTSLSSYVC